MAIANQAEILTEKSKKEAINIEIKVRLADVLSTILFYVTLCAGIGNTLVKIYNV